MIAVVLTVGLVLALAHVAPHVLGVLGLAFIVVLVLWVLGVSTLPVKSVQPALPPEKGGGDSDTRAVGEQAGRAAHDANAESADELKRNDVLVAKSVGSSQILNGSEMKPAEEWGPKPGWVDKSPRLEQRPEGEVYVATATAGPYSTAAECDRELDSEIDRVVQTYVERKLGAGAVVRLNPPFVDDHLIRARWREKVTVSVGNMQSEHALLAFDRSVQTELERLWRQAVVGPRLAYAAAGLSGLLLLVGSVYSVLKWGPGAKGRAAV